MRLAWRSSWAPMLGAVCVWACYGPAWALSGLSAQAWLGNTAYRGADLLVSLLLISRHGMPRQVRWRHPFLLPAGIYHAAASGLFAMAVGWCGPLLAAALYELWPLWAGLFLELYPRPVAGNGRVVWRLLRGGALSVSGAALVVWSQSGGTVADGGTGGWLFVAGVLAALGCSFGPVSAAMGLVWAREQAAAAETDVWRYVAFWRVCSAICGVAGSLAAHILTGGFVAFSVALAFMFGYGLANGGGALLWSLAWRRAGRQAPALQFLGSAAAPLSAVLLWGLGLDSPGAPAMLAAGFGLVAGGNWLARS